MSYKRTKKLVLRLATFLLVISLSTGSLALLFPSPVSAAPTLEIGPNPCLPGESIEVQGNGFIYSVDKKCPVELYIDDIYLDDVYADKSGSFTHSFEAPSSPGDYIFGAMQGCDGGNAFIVLMVRMPPTVETWEEQEVTTTSAYLRGYLSDTGGFSEVGCGFEYGTDTSYGSYVGPSILSVPTEFGWVVEGLTPGTTYHFRAIADGLDSQGIDYGKDMTFTTIDTIAQPENLLPEQGMQDVSLLPTFEWTEVSKAVAYEFQLSADSEFDVLLVDLTTDETAYTLMIELTYNTNYYWRARAVSDNDTKSTWCVSDFRTRPEEIPIPQATDSPQPPYFPPTTSSPPPWPFDPPEPTDPPPPSPLPTTTVPFPQVTDSPQPPDLSSTPELPIGPFPTTGIPFPQVTDSPQPLDMSNTSIPPVGPFPTTGVVIHVTDSPYPSTGRYVLRVNVSGSGQASGEGVYAAGTKVDIVATPESNEWYFDGWTGDISLVDDPYEINTNITVDDNCTITANFKQEGQSGFPEWIIGAVIGGITLISVAGYSASRQFNNRVKSV